MGDTQTASTLVLIAAILQFIFSLLSLVSGGFMILMLLPFYFDPLFMGLFGPILLIPIALIGVLGVIGLFFAILWLNWRQYPAEHKTGLIVTGIFSLLISGILPGLLALIGGAIVPSPSEYRAYEPTKIKYSPTRKYCPSCGAEISDESDLFCWRCGSAL
jgi:hypothetical protein